MSHTQLRAVHRLAVSDRLAVSEDVRLFRVMSIEGETRSLDARRKVHLRCVDGTTSIMLVRTGRDLVRLVIDDEPPDGPQRRAVPSCS